MRAASARAAAYLAGSQRVDGSWIPLWFGNEGTPDQENPLVGTARTLEGLRADLVRDDARAAECRRAAVIWLLGAQNADGGWGGDRSVPSSIEETGVALSALSAAALDADQPRLTAALDRAAAWLSAAIADSRHTASPIGLYFARLWYYEELYPIVFALAGLGRFRARARRSGSQAAVRERA
jgi:squalene-hopene/tetraprenyl-beta-curcumene cyclase